MRPQAKSLLDFAQGSASGVTHATPMPGMGSSAGTYPIIQLMIHDTHLMRTQLPRTRTMKGIRT